MPHGHPDWFGQSVWPKYGEPVDISGTFHLEDGLIHTETITGNGILYKLRLCLIKDTDLSLISIWLTSNDVYLAHAWTSDYWRTSGLLSPIPQLLCEQWNDDDIRAVFCIPTELPFTTSLKINAVCNDGGSVDCSLFYRGWYYNIQ